MATNKKKTTMPTATVSAGSPSGTPAPVQTDVIHVEGIRGLREASKKLQEQGYIAMPGVLGSGGGGIQYGWDEYINSRLECGCDGDNTTHRLPLLHVSSGTAVPFKTKKGFSGEYISWGFGNKVPNVVSLLISLSPYTAAALKFNIDLATGMGPRPMYAYTQYVGGNLTEKKIRFESAGTLLRGWKIDLLRQLHDYDRENSANATVPDGSPSGGNIVTNDRLLGGQSSEHADDYRAELQRRLDEINQQIDEWQQTCDELFGNEEKGIKGFLQNNNLTQTFQQLYADMLQYNICFPELELQQKYIAPKTGKQVTGAMWNPKVTGLRWRNAKVMRLGRMNDQNRIEYVCTSNQWLDNPNATPKDFEIDALPALTAQSPQTDLEDILREARTDNAGPEKRPTHISMPVLYNEYGHPYYPVPAHYAAFSGDVYAYAMTQVSDRKKRRDNANVIGYVIYLHDEYIQRMYAQRECTTNDQKKKLFNEVVSDINKFLKNRDNMGEPIVAYNFVGADGKTYKSWEIVEIEENSKSSAEANKEELAEISSIILFCWGVDSQLIGNTPGTTTRSGGTDLRERYLLKQVQMSLLQQLVLKPLDVIKHHNQWCKPLTWEIQREVLTTLDNSKTGITTAETE